MQASKAKTSPKAQVVKREPRASRRAATNAKVRAPRYSPTQVAELIQWKAEFQKGTSYTDDKENRPKAQALRGTDRRRKADQDAPPPASNARACKTSKVKLEVASPQDVTLMYAPLVKSDSFALAAAHPTARGKRVNVARGNEVRMNKRWAETVKVSTNKKCSGRCPVLY